MNTDDYYGKLTHKQQRFCDLYLTHFNAFKAAVECGYSENTSRKGALLHVPKIQQYLKAAMNRRSQRLEITHDMILRELSKIAFSNMGNYYDEYGCLKRMNELTVDEKGAISYYDIIEIQDGEGFRVGSQSRIKLHNKMSALDKIARHLGFYETIGVKKQETRGMKQEAFWEEEEESAEDGLLVRTPTKAAGGSPECGAESLESKAINDLAIVKDAVVVDRSQNNLPMDYPVEDFELEGIELKTLVALEGVNVSPGRPLMIEGLNNGMIEWEESLKSESPEVRKMGEESPMSESPDDDSDGVENTPLTSRNIGTGSLERGTENMENILTISPLVWGCPGVGKSESKNHLSDLRTSDFRTKNALRMATDTGQCR